ncbi:DUF4340 domain-containing protein [Congregibacter brevis]|uniref:DUF4340 domain-containing protein n=1 Tax=Congregibacter brevis TaxID=3081201 RepID=A0ABZ0IHF5_9GAMM|nr:DUF4340 domain-containing protein [Congregibacter sp. IMCC45268]
MLRILSAAFLVQLVLVAVLYWPETPNELSRDALITGMAVDAVERIQLSNNDGATLVLVLDEGGWRLDLGFPADSNKAEKLLNALLRNDPGFSVAETAGAAKRFEVADSEFRRRVTLGGDGDEATVYLGSTAALGKIHARMSDEDAVYVLSLSSLDVPVDIDSWLDTRLLSRRTPTMFSLYGVDFFRDDGDWTSNDGQIANASLSAKFVDVLGSLQVSGLVDAADDDAANAGEALRVSFGKDNDIDHLVVLHNPESDRYYFQSERFNGVFSTSAYDAERLIDAAKTLLAGGG